MKNPVDDGSFEELGRMYEEIHYLMNGIKSREKKIHELEVEINKETKRLTKQGYKMRELKITVCRGMEK